MTDAKKAETSKPDKASETGKSVSTVEPVNEPTGRASESGDPAVQQLLAQRQAAVMNEDDEQLKQIDKRLVELGFTEYKH